MAYELAFYDLEKLIKAFGFNDFECKVMSYYLDEYCNDMDLSYWPWNVAGTSTQCIKGTVQDARDFVKYELCDSAEFKIYEITELGGCFVEWR